MPRGPVRHEEPRLRGHLRLSSAIARKRTLTPANGAILPVMSTDAPDLVDIDEPGDDDPDDDV